MAQRSTRLFFVVVILVAGTLVGVVGWQTVALAAADRSDPSAAYAALVEAANAGDPRAQELRAAMDKYLAAHRISVDDLGRVAPTNDGESVGMLRLRLVGSAPWELRIMNDTELTDADSVQAYIALRTGAVAALAKAEPSRQIEVVATPDSLLSPTEFLAALGCSCAIAEAQVDVFVGTEWLMSTGGSFDGQSATEVEAGLRAAIVRSLDLYRGISIADVRLTVHQLRVRMTAADAAATVSRAGVLLLDPTSDLQDRYVPRAAIVRVGSTPDLFRWHAEHVLGVSLVPGQIRPDGPGGEAR